MLKKSSYVPVTVAVAGVALVIAACGQQAKTASASSPSPEATAPPEIGKLLTGKDALGDWSTDAPGVRRKLTVRDLPPPFDTPHVDNGPQGIPPPEGATPKVKPGFKIDKFATGLRNPRVVVTAPNGDVFVAESGANQIHVLRDADGDGKAEVSQVYATGLRRPFGVAFYPVGSEPQWVYVANTDSVVRFPYKNGDLTATGASEMVTNTIPGGGQLRGGGHWTRDVQFSADGKKMFVSVGSLTNVNQENNPIEETRALIYEYNPDGTGGRIYASGIRNAVGLAIEPQTKALWCSVNERDGLGDHLVPDYVTSVKEGGFYGWPWYYIGPNEDPRKKGERPELKDKVIVPDVLLQSHMASLDLCFYTGNMFPAEYKGHIFAAEHGSWNRARRTGYKIIRIPVQNGKATGEYEDFVTGFVADDRNVWGRPVGVTTAKDGALLFTDDMANVVWRVSYGGK